MGQSLHLCVCVCLYEYKRKGYISFIQQKKYLWLFLPLFLNGVAFLYSNKNLFGVWIKKEGTKSLSRQNKSSLGVCGWTGEWIENFFYSVLLFEGSLKWLLLLKFSFLGFYWFYWIILSYDKTIILSKINFTWWIKRFRLPRSRYIYFIDIKIK